MKQPIKGLAIGFAVLLIVGTAYYIYLIASFNESTKPINDPKRYSEIINMWPTNLVSHFPSAITESTEFKCIPGLMMGGSSLQIQMTKPKSEIENDLKEFKRRSLATFWGGNVNDHQNMTNGIPTTFFITGGTEDTVFPNDYAVIVIEAHDLNGGFEWNHGETCGVAISTQRNSIVYWAESW